MLFSFHENILAQNQLMQVWQTFAVKVVRYVKVSEESGMGMAVAAER